MVFGTTGSAPWLDLTLYGFIASQFGDVTAILHHNDSATIRVKGFVKDAQIPPLYAVVIVISRVLFAIVFMFSIKFLNFQNR